MVLHAESLTSFIRRIKGKNDDVCYTFSYKMYPSEKSVEVILVYDIYSESLTSLIDELLGNNG